MICSSRGRGERLQKRFCPIPVFPRTRVLALQVIPLVEPAYKLQAPLLRSGLVIDPLLIECFDSTEVSNLLARKTHQFELPAPHHPGGMPRLAEEMLAEFHARPLLIPELCTVVRFAAPVSLSGGRLLLSTKSMCLTFYIK